MPRWSYDERREIFRGSGGKCHRCGRKHTLSRYKRDWNVDHVLPRSHKGPDASYNLEVACIRCNSGKGNNFDELDRATLIANKTAEKVDRLRGNFPPYNDGGRANARGQGTGRNSGGYSGNSRQDGGNSGGYSGNSRQGSGRNGGGYPGNSRQGSGRNGGGYSGNSRQGGGRGGGYQQGGGRHGRCELCGEVRPLTGAFCNSCNRKSEGRRIQKDFDECAYGRCTEKKANWNDFWGRPIGKYCERHQKQYERGILYK